MGIAHGVEYMHQQNVVHGNLKIVRYSTPYVGHALIFLQANILADPDGYARVAGLGVALISSPMPGVDIDRFFHGAAPELVNRQRSESSNTGATKASDVYAFGVLSWEVSAELAARPDNSLNEMIYLQIFAGEVPFPTESRIAGVFSMLMGRRPPRPDHPELSGRLWETIKGCWKVDPAQRKTITEVISVLEAEIAAHRSRSCALGWQNWT